jgi:hypothetical protein
MKFLLLLISLSVIRYGQGLTNASPISSSLSSLKTEKVAAAVIVPGFLTGANEFKNIKDELIAQGLPTIVVPMPSWHWLSCLGGRSARPILERIDFTVQHLVNKLEQDEDFLNGKFPKFDYSYLDAWNDFWENPGGIAEVGGSSLVDNYPRDIAPRGNFPLPRCLRGNKKIALIGHSAGGWVSRIYLSDQEYGGKVYGGSKYIHSLVTLGTPQASAPGPAFASVSWINNLQKNDPPSHGTDTVRTLAVAGGGFEGKQWGDFTKNSYAFCCPNGSDGSEYDGDGMTPIFSSLAMPNSDYLILSKKVNHFSWTDAGIAGQIVAPELYQDMRDNGSMWYGSDEMVAEWLPWILQVTEKGK